MDLRTRICCNTLAYTEVDSVFENLIGVIDGTLFLPAEKPGFLRTLLQSNLTLITIDTADMASSFVGTTIDLHTLRLLFLRHPLEKNM